MEYALFGGYGLKRTGCRFEYCVICRFGRLVLCDGGEDGSEERRCLVGCGPSDGHFG